MKTELKSKLKIDTNYRNISKSYKTSDHKFTIYFQTDTLLEYIHPQIAHLESKFETKADYWFDFYEENNQIVFFKNNNFIKNYSHTGFHKLQGQFNTEFICSLYSKKEHDWLGIFHASTISNKKESIMLIGKSGSGKSTLTTILTNSGYNLIADDNTPILRNNLNTYYLPAGISVKPGAFSKIKRIVHNFDNLPQNYLKNHKGGIKYVPSLEPEVKHVPCNTIVLVNYQPKSKALLEPIDIKTALEILIPDSWISPKPENAKAFLDWISTVTFYKLTYSNNQDVINIFSTIFDND
ncbi:conserved hypothetical protein [Formosa agariphila KMM 3901]|uniref:HPr kinase n=1 Tax=Formosa agariphila (strain DSM 15362 / KCTC 12365 / LMG 23005 / KMM 3901 / M-2Alg 35-1) TaxID=1347342 RepID=T2KRL0_FORAG|nr:hypothetical protein [Formosa agariphila]CDF80654.1 conserved hypothetical protein [Formosa agariphila KMM 3901]